MKGKSTHQNIYRMLEVVKDRRKKVARDSILLFVDFSKAFDKVKHEAVNGDFEVEKSGFNRLTL